MNIHSISLLAFPEVFGAIRDLRLGRRDALAEYEALVVQGAFPTPPAAQELRTLVAWFTRILLRLPNVPWHPWEEDHEFWADAGVAGRVHDLEFLARVRREALALESFWAFIRDCVREFPEDIPEAVRHLELESLPWNLSQALGVYIDEQGLLKEDSIPGIRDAKRRVTAMQSDLRLSAQRLVREHGANLTGDFSTLRDGRTVLPLKSGSKGRVEGIIHASSQSGETLYIEPFELLEKNNAIAQAEADYRAEIHRVLKDLSARVAACHQAYDQLAAHLDPLDRAMARSRYGIQHRAVLAGSGPAIKLHRIRHPLLGRKAVPISMDIPPQKRLLVISGPNTGGKTVTMKTLGLAVLMNQASVPVLAEADSELPWYDDVLVDIGDEQSIAQELSTFGGHLHRIKQCLESATERTLVILDELGSGTDPEEGSALAIGIARSFLDKGCLTFVSSHYGPIKAMGYAEPSAMNLSMAYSLETDAPSYQVIPDAPGASHAIDTAKRIGLPATITDLATQIVQGKGDPVYDLVTRLAREHDTVKALRLELQGQEARLAKAEQDHQSAKTRLEEERRALERDQVTEASRFMAEARSRVERLLGELESWRKAIQATGAPEAAQALPEGIGALARQEIRGLGEELDATREKLDQKNRDRQTPALGPGIRVRVASTGREGTITREGKRGSWEVEVLGKRFVLPGTDLEPLAPSKVQTSAPLKPIYQVDSAQTAKFTLDLRGCRMEEALRLLEQQMDAAIVQNLKQWGIIHGKGNGILQKAIHEWLGRHPSVASFAFARPEDGGSGKTIVELH